MSNPHQPIMVDGEISNPAEAGIQLYRMQDRRDPYRYIDFDPRIWTLIVVPTHIDEDVVGYTTADPTPACICEVRATLSNGDEIITVNPACPSPVHRAADQQDEGQ